MMMIALLSVPMIYRISYYGKIEIHLIPVWYDFREHLRVTSKVGRRNIDMFFRNYNVYIKLVDVVPDRSKNSKIILQ